MITCYLRYVVDPFKLQEFETYGKMWIPLVEKFGAESIMVTFCRTKVLTISLLHCFRFLRLRPMKPIALMQPAIQNAKLLCVTIKKRSVSLAMSSHLCVRFLSSKRSRSERKRKPGNIARNIVCVPWIPLRTILAIR